MNYKKIHDNIINRSRLESRKKLKRSDINYVYYEKHHIIPEHFFINRKRKGPPGWLEGNPDNPNNLILLTAREHFVIHQLLIKIYSEHKASLVFATKRMTSKNSEQNDRSNNKLYEWLRKLYSDAMSEQNKGKKCPAVSLSNKRRTGTKRRPNSKEGNLNISIAKKGKPSKKKGKKFGSNPKISANKLNKPTKQSKSILCIELNLIFHTFAEAARYIGSKDCGQHISKVCQNINKNWTTSGGYHWRYI